MIALLHVLILFCFFNVEYFCMCKPCHVPTPTPGLGDTPPQVLPPVAATDQLPPYKMRLAPESGLKVQKTQTEPPQLSDEELLLQLF